MKLPGKQHTRYVQTHNDGMLLEQGQLCTIDELKKFAREMYLKGFMSSGEGWNGEYPFSDRGLDAKDDKNLRDDFTKVWKEITNEPG